MKLQERTYREMTINSSQLIIPRETYQREACHQSCVCLFSSNGRTAWPYMGLRRYHS